MDDEIFHLFSSADEGKTWKLESKSNNSFWTIRDGRDRSKVDKERLFRARNMGMDVTLITFRDGMSVYDVP